MLNAAAEGGGYFDLLGGPKRTMNLLRSLVSVQTQELFSSVCGQYCIFYMSLGAMGHSMEDIVHVLVIQGEDSDRFVKCFVNLFYGVEY